MTWREYQEAAATFFSTLGMETEIEARIEGSRSTHAVDVHVRFTAYGMEHIWIVECKHWNRPVSKEAVLTLQGVAADLGAHRAFLLCEEGFQSGAVTQARLTNVTLTNLDDLRANAEADIDLMRWDNLYKRLSALGEKIDSLTVVTHRDSRSGTSALKPGVEDFFQNVGIKSILEMSLQRVRVGQFPVACGPDETGDTPRLAYDLAEFFELAEPVVDDLERWTNEQVAKPWPNKPKPAPVKSTGAGPTLVVVNEPEPPTEN